MVQCENSVPAYQAVGLKLEPYHDGKDVITALCHGFARLCGLHHGDRMA